MTDSSSFSSLLALVDSHLSRTSIQDQNGVQSDSKLTFPPGQRIGIPTFQLGRSPIDSVLAEQVSNMLKAKEQKRLQEEEQQRLIEETQRLKIEEDNDIIDLMQAVQINTPYKPEPKKENLSSASSLESLFEPNFTECDEEIPMKSPEPLLPITTDMSYILRQKVKRGKCSQFGKVLTSRLKPVAAPYLKEMIESSVIRFQFDTPSPCDLIKEKLRKPSSYNTYNFNIFDMI